MDEEQCEILAPVVAPSKVACVGLNYKDHCKEMNMEAPTEPIFFNKFPSCIIGPFEGIPYPDLTKVTEISLVIH